MCRFQVGLHLLFGGKFKSGRNHWKKFAYLKKRTFNISRLFNQSNQDVSNEGFANVLTHDRNPILHQVQAQDQQLGGRGRVFLRGWL